MPSPQLWCYGRCPYLFACGTYPHQRVRRNEAVPRCTHLYLCQHGRFRSHARENLRTVFSRGHRISAQFWREQTKLCYWTKCVHDVHSNAAPTRPTLLRLSLPCNCAGVLFMCTQVLVELIFQGVLVHVHAFSSSVQTTPSIRAIVDMHSGLQLLVADKACIRKNNVRSGTSRHIR